MQRKIKHNNWISIVLSLVLLIGTFPINATALDSAPPIGTDLNSDILDVAAYNEEYIDDTLIGEVVEITSLREENVKHFRLADGTYEAVSYAYPVHRKNKNGVWEDIDNTLTLMNIGTSQKYSTSDSRVKFADSFKINSELFVLSENGYSISMSLIDDEALSKLSSSNATQVVPATEPIVCNPSNQRRGGSFASLDDATKIDNRSSITYGGLKNNMAIEYVLQGNNLKENIIINTPCENYEYQFQMNLVGLEAELDDRGNIILCDLQTTQLRYFIPAPYMYDNNGEYSTSVTYELSLIKNDVYLLKICADNTWINSPSRSLPVTITPSMITDMVFWDAYTYSSYPDETYGHHAELWVSNYRTSYFYMNLPEIPSGATFNSAYLYASYYYNISTGSLLAGAYQVLGYWDEGSITYNNAPAISTTILDTEILTASEQITESSPGLASFDITDAVSDWYDNGNSNFGIAIKRVPSTTHTNSSVILKAFEAFDDDYARMSFNYTYYVSDGVYAFQNYDHTSNWITVEDDSVWEGSHIQQVSSNFPPASTSVFDRSSLFKISRINGTSRYIIRSMLNNNLSFGISGTEIITKKIPSADSDVSDSDTFHIEWDGYGFLIRPYGSSNVIQMASTSTANLTTVPKTSITSFARWNLLKYTGANRQGITLYSPSSWKRVGHIVGTTGTAILVGWSTYINANTLSMDIATGYEDLGTLVWNSSDNQITLSASNPGRIRLNGRIKYADGTETCMGYFEYVIVPQEGTYYIQNASTGKYIDIEGPSQNVGAIIQQWQYHTGNQEKWQIEHVPNSGGYVRLKSLYSNLYIGVDSSDSSLIKQYSTQNDHTLWKIERSTTGNLIFTCKATESANTVLSVPLSSNSNGTNLTQLTYTDNSNTRDEWYLVKKVISYVNYYDSSFVGNSTLIQNIPTANSFANLVYSRYYNVGMFMDGSASRYVTTVESCPTGDGSQCSSASCGTDCNVSHHKNGKVMSDQIYNSPRESDHLYVLWMNRSDGTYCKEEDGAHTDHDAIASVYGKRPVIIFQTIKGSSSEKLIRMASVLVHETAHTLKMNEVYDNPGHDVPGATECFMERFHSSSAYIFYLDVLSGAEDPFCDSCNEAMKDLTANITMPGS